MHENLLISRVKTWVIANLSAFVRAVMGVYYIMIIIKISKKRILIDRIFHFRRCQVIRWRNEMEPFDCAWFGCCHSGVIHSDDYGIPTSTCSSNKVTRSAEHWAYPSSKSFKTDANSCTKRRECLSFKITWAQISSRDARFILSLHAGAVVWSLLPDRDTFRRCFDLGFSWSDGRVKIDHYPKRTYADMRLSKYIVEAVYINKP